MILVTTAGKVGTEAVRSLFAREVPVRVLVRDPGGAKALADAGAEVAVGDLDVPASVDKATVPSCGCPRASLPPFRPCRGPRRSYAAAAARAGSA